MICPKCGFSQPDDIYCANCGINIRKYTQKNRKKRYAKVIVVALACIGILYAANFFYHFHEDQKRKISESKESPPEPTAQPQSQVPKSRAVQPAPAGQTATGDGSFTGRPGSQEKKAIQPETNKEIAERKITTPKAETSLKKKTAPAETGEREMTAMDWFEKGRALDNDSEEEIGYYLKALELNSQFAPAHFRLGAIYFRQAEYELADREFAKFLQLASEEEKEAYDIYVYYSPAEVENFLGSRRKVEPPEKGTASELKGEAEETVSEESPLATEEVKTAVKFASIRGHIKVPVLLNDTLTVNMLLDTGAGITILSKNTAGLLKLNVHSGKSVELKTLAHDIRAPIASLESIRFGEFGKQDFPVAVSDLNLVEQGFDGILGMDFLSDYAIKIDRDRGQIILAPTLSNKSW